MMVFRAMSTVARWGAAGPKGYAEDTHIKNKTMLEWMDITSTYWKQLTAKPPVHNVNLNIIRSDHLGLHVPVELAGSAGGALARAGCGNLSGVYFGGSVGRALETKWPLTIAQPTAGTLHAHWPHGCTVGFWCTANALLQPDGRCVETRCLSISLASPSYT
jgi:hypothetical protein